MTVGGEDMAKGDKLTPKQELFVKEYLIDLNATQAYKRAGYSAASDNIAGVEAHKLLKNPKIQAEIQKANNKRAEKLDISAEWVLESLKTIAERCMQAEPVMIREGNEWVESGEYKFDSSGANKSLELIGKHLKLFTDKIEHSGETGVRIINDIPRNTNKSD
jgi:phage terminase small subunit